MVFTEKVVYFYLLRTKITVTYIYCDILPISCSYYGNERLGEGLT